MNKGMVRRIDELGRIVIPKEMRKKLKMKEGESITFFIEDDCLMLRKYCELEGISSTVESLVRVLYEKIGDSIFVSNNDRILYASEDILSEYQRRELSQYYKEYVKAKDHYDSIEIIKGKIENNVYLFPFYLEGEMIGSLGILIKRTPYHIIDKKILEFCIEIIERELLSCV